MGVLVKPTKTIQQHMRVAKLQSIKSACLSTHMQIYIAVYSVILITRCTQENVPKLFKTHPHSDITWIRCNLTWIIFDAWQKDELGNKETWEIQLVTFWSLIVEDHLTLKRVTYSSQKGHKGLPGACICWLNLLVWNFCWNVKLTFSWVASSFDLCVRVLS